MCGGAGNDTFIAGAGNDVLRGGAGDDAFIFNAPLNASTNVDQIRDFGVGNDTIRLDDAVFAGLTVGALSATAFALSTDVAEADDRVIYDQSTGNLFFDTNGGSRDDQVLFATLTNKANVSSSDFFVV
jgi:Ca2+-binding RTX toxin-like protein